MESFNGEDEDVDVGMSEPERAETQLAESQAAVKSSTCR